MGATGRTSDSDLDRATVEQRLYDEPYCFHFFQAVRLLHLIFPNSEPVGRFARPSQEPVRFASNNTLAFPPSEVHALESAAGRPPRMTVNLMGITGPLGVLPLYYTQLLIDRIKARDHSAREFFDLFNHRLISMFYAAWEKYRALVAYERGERDRATQALLSLIGLGTPGLPDRQTVRDDAMLYYSGLLAQRPVSAAAVSQVLSDYFDVPVEVVQFTGAWYQLDIPTQCQFEDADSASEQLGFGAVVGDEVWNQQSRARLRVGPLGLERYRDFLPSGTAYIPLRTLARFMVNDQIDFEVQLVLRREDVPACALGAEEGPPAELGWITWIKSAPLKADLDDTILPL